MTTRRHYRAYRLATLREFAGLAGLAPGVRELAEDAVCYVTDDLDLVADPLALHTSLLSSGATDEWRAFCIDHLAVTTSTPDKVDVR